MSIFYAYLNGLIKLFAIAFTLLTLSIIPLGFLLIYLLISAKLFKKRLENSRRFKLLDFFTKENIRNYLLRGVDSEFKLLMLGYVLLIPISIGILIIAGISGDSDLGVLGFYTGAGAIVAIFVNALVYALMSVLFDVYKTKKDS